MFCKNCGKELLDDAKFCASCGTPTANPPAGQTPPVEPAPPADEPAAPAPAAEDGPAVTESPDGTETPAGESGPSAAETSAPENGSAMAETPAAAEAPASSGSAAAVSAPVYQPPAQKDAAAPNLAPVKRRRGLIVLGICAVVIIVVIVLAVKLISGLIGGGGSKAAYVYLNDDYELMYLANLKEKTEALEITDDAGYGYSVNVQFSPDGKTIYYIDMNSALYKVSASELKKDSRPERIARNVLGFQVLKDGKILYWDGDYSSRRLNLYDGKETCHLVRDYYDYQLSEDQKTLYYTEMESDGTITLYKMALSKDAAEEELLDGATVIYNNYDASTLVYGIVRDGGYNEFTGRYENNNITLYSCKPGEKGNKLVSDVYSVDGISVDGSKVSFYYYVEEVNSRTLYDFVTDTNAAQDAALVQEELTYPYWDYYYPIDLYTENSTVYYIDIDDNKYPIDTSALQAESGLPAEDLIYMFYWEIYDLAYADAQERYEQALDEYDAKYDDWSAAKSRENMRETLKGTQYDQTFFSLYHYSNGDSGDPIATEINDFYSVCSSVLDGIFLYQKADITDSGKVADLADLNYYSEIYDRLGSGSADGVWYQNVGGKESELDIDDGVNINGIYVLNGKEAVLTVYDGYYYSLEAYSIGKDALAFSSTVFDDDFSGLQKRTNSSGSEVLYLFTDVVSDRYGSRGDFCVYSGGKLQTVATEVYGAFVLSDSGTTYVITDTDNYGDWEISLLKDGKLTAITDETQAWSMVFLDDTQLLYLSDDDLYLWNGKENRRVARDVEAFWTSESESYNSFIVY